MATRPQGRTLTLRVPVPTTTAGKAGGGTAGAGAGAWISLAAMSGAVSADPSEELQAQQLLSPFLPGVP